MQSKAAVFSMSPFLDDSELVFQFKTGDNREIPFTGIVKKYQERLYWHIRRMVVVHEDADDVLQNVFIKAWKGLDGFRGESQLSTWLYKIATNETYTFLENRKKRMAHSLDNADNDLANRIKADEHFDGNKIEWKLELAIQTLPNKQKTVFMLRYYDEMPYEEMSRILGTSEGALKASYHHAVKKVEDFLLQQQ